MWTKPLDNFWLGQRARFGVGSKPLGLIGGCPILLHFYIPQVVRFLAMRLGRESPGFGIVLFKALLNEVF